MSQGACTLVLRAQQEWTFPDKMYRDSNLLVTSCLRGLFGCDVGGVWEWWVPRTVSHHHRKLPGLQPAPSPLQEITLGQGSSQKSGRLSYSGSMTLPWLAGTPRDLWVGVNLFLYLCVCSKQKLLWFTCHLSDASSTSTCIGLVGWVGMASWVAPHHQRSHSLPEGELNRITISCGVLVWFGILN